MRLVDYMALPAPLQNRYLRRRIFSSFPIFKDYWDKKVLASFLEFCSIDNGSTKQSDTYVMSIPDIRCGIGHVLAEWNTGLIMAQQVGAKFISLSLPHYWDELLNFNEVALPFDRNFDHIKSIKRIRLPYVPFSSGPEKLNKLCSQLIQLRPQEAVLYLLYDGQNAYDHTSTREFLRKQFWGTSLSDNIRKTVQAEMLSLGVSMNLAVHIRRGDIVSNPRWQERIVAINWFRDQIEKITAKSSVRFCVDVFTNAEDTDIVSGLSGDWKLRVFNKLEDRESFGRIACADIIVGSKSGFSFFAALLSKAKICCFPKGFWHDTEKIFCQ